MGINFMQAFIENEVPSACKPANLAVEANSREEKFLVIDLYNVVDTFSEDPSIAFDFFQWKLNFQAFLFKLKEFDIRPIFVEDGPHSSVSPNNLKSWTQRGYQKYKKVIKAFADLERGTLPEKLPKLRPGEVSELLKFELGYQDWVFEPQLDQEGDRLCVALAIKYKAFGILSQDSDFLAFQYPLDIKLFSSQHLNVKTLDTKFYDREALVNYLGVEIGQMPLLATLKGNDFVAWNSLVQFHRSLIKPFSKRVDCFKAIKSIAGFIRENPNLDCSELVKIAFNDPSNAALLEQSIKNHCSRLAKIAFNKPSKATLIEQSIKNYHLTRDEIDNSETNHNQGLLEEWKIYHLGTRMEVRK